MYPWKAQLRWEKHTLLIRLTDASDRWLLRARLPARPVQRTALVTLLAGAAQYGGCRLSAVMDADGLVGPMPDVGAPGAGQDSRWDWVHFECGRSGGAR